MNDVPARELFLSSWHAPPLAALTGTSSAVQHGHVIGGGNHLFVHERDRSVRHELSSGPPGPRIGSVLGLRTLAMHVAPDRLEE